MASAAGALGAATRFALAQKAFAHTAAYDGAISNYLTALDGTGGRARVSRGGSTCSSRRSQDCATARTRTRRRRSTATRSRRRAASARYRQLQGKELSYNNIADADAAWECVKSFAEPACVIVKHANPCGVARGADARSRPTARRSPPIPTSAFGGIIAFNRALDAADRGGGRASSSSRW